MIGFPPFFGDDPVQTCRKVRSIRGHAHSSAVRTHRARADIALEDEPEVARGSRARAVAAGAFDAEGICRCGCSAMLTPLPQALDFVRSLITDADTRLGARGGVEEIKAHPWFAGIDWEHLNEAEAPWQPPNGRAIGSLLDTLAGMPKTAPAFAPTVKQLCANFDDFSALAADDPRHGFHGGGAGEAAASDASKPGSKARKRFIGYTFKRNSDGKLGFGRTASATSAAAAGTDGAAASGGLPATHTT